MLMQQYVAMMILKLHESSVNRDCNRNRDRNKKKNVGLRICVKEELK